MKNFWISNCIKVFLFATVAGAILSIARIGTTFGVRFAYDTAQLLSWVSACLSQILGLSESASSFLRMASHQKAAKLLSNFVIEIIFALRGMSKFHQSCTDVLADWLFEN